MQDPASELPRINLPSTPVNRSEKKRAGVSYTPAPRLRARVAYKTASARGAAFRPLRKGLAGSANTRVSLFVACSVTLASDALFIERGGYSLLQHVKAAVQPRKRRADPSDRLAR
jgi:hypothetical protein